MEFKKTLLLFVIGLAVFSVANAGLLTWTEKETSKIDAVFPELIYNTESCLTDCQAKFKYCLDSDSDYEMSFNIPEVTSYGYFTTESETHKENTDKCLKEETLTHKCDEKEIDNGTKDCDYNYTVCNEWEQKDVTTESKVWHEGLPSEKAGCYEVTVYGKKKAFEDKDWIPTIVKKGFLWDTEYIQDKWAWWNGTGFTKNQALTLYTVLGTYNNYSALIPVTYDSDMQADFDDVRFIDNDNTTELKYWINNYTASTSANFWVNVSLTNATNKTIYMYYGNATVGNNSNKSAVFTDVQLSHCIINQSGETRTERQGMQIVPTVTNLLIIGFNAEKNAPINRSFILNGTAIPIGNSSNANAGTQYYMNGTVSGSEAIFDYPYRTEFNKTYVLAGDKNGTSYTKYLCSNGGTGISYRTGFYWNGAMNWNKDTRTDQTGWGFIVNNTTVALTPDATLYWGAEASTDYIQFSALPSPANNSNISTSTVNFNVTPISNTVTLMNCSLYYNTSLNQSNTSVPNNTIVNFQVTGATDGYHYYYIKCENGSISNTTADTFFTIDTTQPMVSFVSPTESAPASFVGRNYARVNLSATDTHGISSTKLEWNYTNESFQTNTSAYWFSNKTALADGEYYFRAWANDTFGNWNVTETRMVEVDTTAPTTTATATNDDGNYVWGTVSNSSLTITLSCDDGTGAGCNITQYCFDQANTCTPNNTYSAPISHMDSGTWYIRYNSNDSVGNQETNQSKTMILNLYSPVMVTTLLNSTTNTSSVNLNGWCNATDADLNNLSYYWTVWKDNVFNTSGNYGNVNSSQTGVCSQISPNETNLCGGLSTGNYSYYVTVDGDLDTFNNSNDFLYPGTRFGAFFGQGGFYINFSIPNGTTNAVWYVNSYGGWGSQNFSIPSNCLSNNELRLYYDYSWIPDKNETVGCWNYSSNAFEKIYTNGYGSGSSRVLGQRIFWGITNYPQATIQNIFTNSTPVTDGNWTLQCTAYDGLTNSSAMNGSLLIDSAAPSTTIVGTKTPSGNPYTFGTISTENIDIDLTCDDGSGIGCAVTRYCFDSTNACTPNTTYTTTIADTNHGTHYIRYRSNDTYNNTEAVNNRTVVIDANAPVMASVIANSTTNDSTAVLRMWCNATDVDDALLDYYWTVWKSGVNYSSGINASLAQGVMRNLVTIPTAELNESASWKFACTAYDGYRNSTEVNSTALGIYDYNLTIVSSALEKEVIRFWINFSLPVTNVYFIYNGTYYVMSNPSGDNWNYEFTLPAVATATNYTYGYNWTVYGDSNQKLYTMLVNDFGINTDGNGSHVMNITFMDEQNESDITPNMTMQTIFEVVYGDGSTEIVSFNTTGEANFYLSTNTTLYANAQFQYSKANFRTREYFLYNATITNGSLVNYTLYNILTANSSGTLITVKDPTYRPLQNIYIKVQRFYVSQDAYVTVAMGKTDERGETRIYLEPNDVYYIFLFEEDGDLITTLEPLLVTSDTLNFVIDPQNYTDIFAGDSIDTLVTFNNLTKTWHVTLDNPSGIYSQICYSNTKLTALAATQICTGCVNSSSTTYVCNDTTGFDNDAEYVIQVKGYGSSDYLYSEGNSGYGWAGIEREGLLGLSGIFLAGLLVFGCAALGIFNPVASLALAGIALIVGAFTGVLVLSFTSVICIVCSIGLIIWRMSR